MAGSGGGGTQSVTQEFKPPEWLVPYWKAGIESAGNIANRPYEQSGLAQVAPWNDFMDHASKMVFDKAMYGTPMSNAANSAFMNAAQGNYANPYAQNVSGIAAGAAYNPYATNEYNADMLKQIQEQMTGAYTQGAAADLNAAAARSGAYGGSAHELMQQKGLAGLEKQIGDASTRFLQGQQQFLSNAYNQDVANQLQANAQAGGFWGQDVNNILQGGALGLQGANQYNQDLQQLMSAGNAQNQYFQKLLDQANNQWNTQQQYDANQWDYFMNNLGRASGVFSGQTTTQPSAGNPWGNLAGLLGVGAGAYTLMR